ASRISAARSEMHAAITQTTNPGRRSGRRTGDNREDDMAKALLVIVAVGALMTAGIQSAPAADMKPIHTQKVKDVVVTLESESGQWKPSKNDFVLTFTSAQDKKPVDVGPVSLNTSMAMPGMAPMVAGATLTPEDPGRYRGTIEFPDRRPRQVTA